MKFLPIFLAFVFFPSFAQGQQYRQVCRNGVCTLELIQSDSYAFELPAPTVIQPDPAVFTVEEPLSFTVVYEGGICGVCGQPIIANKGFRPRQGLFDRFRQNRASRRAARTARRSTFHIQSRVRRGGLFSRLFFWRR